MNLTGVWNTVRAAVPYIVERKGYILNVASQSAIMPMPMMIPYTAAKAGVDNMSRALRMELYPTGVRVGTVYYSWCRHEARARHRRRRDGTGRHGRPEVLHEAHDGRRRRRDHHGRHREARAADLRPEVGARPLPDPRFMPLIEQLIARDPRNAKAIERGDTIAQAVNDPSDARSSAEAGTETKA